LTPYINGIQDAIDDPMIRAVIVPGPARSGKTVAAENALFKRLKYGPMTDVLWYLPGAMFDNYTDTTFAPLFELHPEIASKIGKGKSDNKRELKRIGGRFVMLLPANKRKIIGRQAPFIVGDEIDAYPKGLIDNFRQQVSIRARAYGNIGKAYLCSHADAGWTGGIAAAWLESSRGVWWWPCPHCDLWSSPCPTAEIRTVLDYGRPDGMAGDDLLDHVEATARLLCPHCGVGIENSDKEGMLALGRWVFDGEIIDADGNVAGSPRTSDTAGFWIHGTMSPFVSWGQLAREYVGALVFFENTKRSARLKEVTVKSLGEVFAGGDSSTIDPARLRRRAKAVDEAAAGGEHGHRLKTVPRWALYLTAAVDVGGDKFDVLVQGWGYDGEGCIVDRFTMKAGPDGRSLSPGMRQADWSVVRDQVMKAVYPLADNPNRGLPIASTAIDTGGVPGVTWKAREFGRQMKLGMCAGINAYRLRLIKGAARATAPEIGNGREVNRDDQGKPLDPAVTEYDLGVFKLKQLVAERFAIDTVGPGYLHLPVKFDARYIDEMTNETLVDGKWERRGPNETFDLLVYNEAARQMLKPERPGIDWINRPPAWARPITLVAPSPEAVASVGEAPAALVVAAPKVDRRQALMERLAR
jgi:phage terminase large subunit GpA-like protein